MAAYAEHTAARAANDALGLITVAEEFERIGVLRYATEAAADAARAFLDAGRHDSARRAAALSRELFIDGQGGLQPAIEGLTVPAVELSPREAQLVELAKRGLSNPQMHWRTCSRPSLTRRRRLWGTLLTAPLVGGHDHRESAAG